MIVRGGAGVVLRHRDLLWRTLFADRARPERSRRECRRHTCLCYPVRMNERKEPTYLLTEKQVAEKSEIARRFLDTRTRLNENVDKADNFLVKRFYNIDHNAYLEGPVPAKYKELMGLAASACLRCDDCIDYHMIQAYRLGVTRAEQEEALNVALVVGGSIVIPHLRRAYELLSELHR